MHFGITKRPTTDYISPYNNAGLVSKLSEKYPPKTLKIAVSTTPLSFDARPGEPLRIFSQVLYRQKLKTLTYILPLIVWVYLHSIFLWWTPKDATSLQQNAYRPFKVVQGRWFWHHSKGRMQLPISH